MENQSNSFFDLVMRDYGDQLDLPMTVDELSTDEYSTPTRRVDSSYPHLRQVGYEDNDGNLIDARGDLTFVRRRLFDDDDYLTFDSVRTYEEQYENFLNDQSPDDTIISYREFLELYGLPLSIRQLEEQPENMLDRITLYTIDPVRAKEKEPVGVFECPICYDDTCLTQRVVPSCRHEYCKPCMLLHLDSFQDRQLIPNCALCREPYSYLEIFEPNVFEEVAHCVRREVV